MSGVAFFVIAEGEAAVIVDSTRVGTMGPGDHFGELAMTSERERTATVEAVTPMRCPTIQFMALPGVREKESRRDVEAPPARREDRAQGAEPSHSASRERAGIEPGCAVAVASRHEQ